MSIARSIVRSGCFVSPFVLMLCCQQLNPEFCATHPQDVDCAGVGIDAGSCTNDSQCVKPTPVCDIARSMCVQCTAAETNACGASTPVCGADEQCHACAVDADCASLTCLPDGSCASVIDVLYVNPDGSDTATCMPDDHCSLARGLSLIDGTKSTIRLDAAHYGLLGTLTLPNDLHLVGRDAVIDRDTGGSGIALAIPDSTTISLDYVTVQGGDGSGGHGIRCTNATLTLREVTVQGNGGAGIHSTDCQLTISHSQIVSNQGIGIMVIDGSLALTRSVVFANQGGGVSIIGATYDVENDIVIKNGGPNSLFGGLAISLVGTPAVRVFSFNTVAQNQAPIGTTPGVLCNVVTTPLALSSSIVFDNGAGTQVEGTNCTWSYSDIGSGIVSIPAGSSGSGGSGSGNISSAPLFVDPVHNNFHLQVSSPARDAADPAATLAVDIDGDFRPQGAGRDMGADEIK